MPLAGHLLSHSFTLPDGAKIAYDVLGSQHLEKQTPFVFVPGLSCLGGDFEKLSWVLAEKRPVLIFDNRGIGQSTYSTPAKDDKITIESMARDAVILIQGLGFKDVVLCGYSMGGSITQQILLLPYHPTSPLLLPFRITHVFLTGTMASPVKKFRYRIQFAKPPAKGVRKLSIEEKRDLVRDLVEHTFDPEWLQVERNQERLRWHLDRMIEGRPFQTIQKQLRATGRFEFRPQFSQLSPSTPVLVIHGENDFIVPPHCGQEVLRLIPWAKKVQVGNRPGQVPNDEFGHSWWEYFDIEVWRDVIEVFLERGHLPDSEDGGVVRSKL